MNENAANSTTLPANSPLSLSWFKHWLWDREILLRKNGTQTVLLCVLSAAALLLELSYHHGGLGLREAFAQKTVVVFYNVKAVVLSEVGASMASVLLTAAVCRTVFSLLIALLDLAMYRKVTGRSFDWEGMINTAAVNCVFLLTVVFTFTNPLVESWMKSYNHLLDSVPTLIHLNGPLALLLACLLGDFCFYWSHRWSHKIRFFWYLGHINHHRNRDLCQLTQAVDPQALLLDTAGGKVFVLLLLPLITKLFSLDIRDSGWALIAIMAFDAWTDPSHSVSLYYAETRFPFLKHFRKLLVTPSVHYTHHSREERHNITDGCNFGARTTLWDRLFGTYVEPPDTPPETGLFSDTADYCRTPLRFLFRPWVQMLRELGSNKLRYWPAILFGHASYTPPVPLKSER
jgi:sterol desaturase/sphingolipid hydroxylase (fatty acid hydroxylase superfamily)